MINSISPLQLKKFLSDGQEIALFDLREHGQYGEGHLFFACSLPYSRLEFDISRLAPRKNCRIVIYDQDGHDVSLLALTSLQSIGYSNVSILEGGASGWAKAGFTLFAGVNLPSKTFGELVEHQCHTPRLSVQEVAGMIESGQQFVLLDGRPLSEFKKMNIPTDRPDDLFPTIALSDSFSGTIGVLFIIALISALFPSVDGAITSLTSSYCIDILKLREKQLDEKKQKSTRLKVHIGFAVLFFLMVLLFKLINDKLIIDFILKMAGITYGPLLGLFAFGILTRKKINENLLWTRCTLAPLLTLFIDMLSSPEWYEKKLHIQLGLTSMSETIFNGYKIGNELILINGILTFVGLWLITVLCQAHSCKAWRSR